MAVDGTGDVRVYVLVGHDAPDRLFLRYRRRYRTHEPRKGTMVLLVKSRLESEVFPLMFST